MTEGRKKGRKEWSDDTQHALHWLEREIAQWVHTMKDRSDDPSHHERMLLPRSYISLLIYGMGIVHEGYAGFLSLYVNASLSYVDFCCLFVYSCECWSCVENVLFNDILNTFYA